MNTIKQIFLTGFFIIFTSVCDAQQSPYFSALSNVAYPQKVAAVKNRKVPVIYPDKKNQKAFEEIVADRNESLADDFINNRVLYDSVLLKTCNNVIQKLRVANPGFPYDSISLYINRSVITNASSWGEGSVFINLGTFLWLDNEDELALLTGHELSHKFLQHFESKARKNISIFSSQDFKDELKEIRKSKDGKYERYKDLVKDLVTQSGKHSRYKESEADSLGMVMIRNAGYDVKKAATLLLKLDHSADFFNSGNIYDVRGAFEKAGAESYLFKENKRYNGLSMAAVTMNADKGIDTIKTHPDCIVRWRKISGNTTNDTAVNCCIKLTSAMQPLKERALTELVRSAYENNRLTLCIHLCLFAKANGYDLPFYNYFISAAFSGIVAADRHFEKFASTDARASAGSTLKELQDFIFKANTETVSKISLWYLENSGDQASEDFSFARLKYDTDVLKKDRQEAQKKLQAQFPNSKYSYLFKPKTP